MINKYSLSKNVTSIQCLDSLNSQENTIVQYFNSALFDKNAAELNIIIANEFDVRLTLNEGEPTSDLLQRAREVMSQIVEMDLEANKNQQNTIEKYQPYIYEVEINLQDDEVNLEYVSSIVNTAWGMFFRRTKEGKWLFDNIG
ncbi:hypothetical protein [Psychrobacter sp. FME61]|uniref:hypothetical protein n=1 Tax=unclassified Psychrobacter TaxID=196806 RepID=UPI001866EB29|nr:hypothetical protein [Psychrobacter sp. FME61]